MNPIFSFNQKNNPEKPFVNNSTKVFGNSNSSSSQQTSFGSFPLATEKNSRFDSNLSNKPQPIFGAASTNRQFNFPSESTFNSQSTTFATGNNQSSNIYPNLSNPINPSTGVAATSNTIFPQSTIDSLGVNNSTITGPNNSNQAPSNSAIFSFNNPNPISTNNSFIGQSTAQTIANQTSPTGAFSVASNNLSHDQSNPISINNNTAFSFGSSSSNASAPFAAPPNTNSLSFANKSTNNSLFSATNSAQSTTATNSGFGTLPFTPTQTSSVSSSVFSSPQQSIGFSSASIPPVSAATVPSQSGFSLGSVGVSTAVASSSIGGLSINLSLAAPSSTAAQSSPFGAASVGLGTVTGFKPASPLASTSVSAKKGLGGSPISDSSKSIVSKDSAQKFSIVKQVKDTELQPEIKETVETFKKFVAEQKKLREEIVKSNDVANLMMRVDEESQILRHSISEVANGLQKIQVQSNKLKSDITKDQSSIKIAQTNSDPSRITIMDHSESSIYFTNKVRELETRVGLYLQEIEVVESMCNSSNKQALTTRDLVEIIRKMDDEFIGLAAKLYMVHERVKTAKVDFLRRLKQSNNNQNPFASIEGRFGETFESISGINNTTSYKKPNFSQNATWKISDNVGSSPFDNSCYLNQASSFSVPNVNSSPKPNIFGINNNNNQSIVIGATTTSTPFSFTNTTSTFALNKPPTNLFLNDSVSNKKRR